MAGWNPADHPRNPRDGRFIEKLGGLADLSVGASLFPGGSVYVDRTDQGFTIDGPGGERKEAKTVSAARLAALDMSSRDTSPDSIGGGRKYANYNDFRSRAPEAVEKIRDERKLKVGTTEKRGGVTSVEVKRQVKKSEKRAKGSPDREVVTEVELSPDLTPAQKAAVGKGAKTAAYVVKHKRDIIETAGITGLALAAPGLGGGLRIGKATRAARASRSSAAKSGVSKGKVPRSPAKSKSPDLFADVGKTDVLGNPVPPVGKGTNVPIKRVTPVNKAMDRTAGSARAARAGAAGAGREVVKRINKVLKRFGMRTGGAADTSNFVRLDQAGEGKLRNAIQLLRDKPNQTADDRAALAALIREMRKRGFTSY